MQAQRNQGIELVALFVGAMDLVAHALRVPDIGIVKSDVEVAHQHQMGVGDQFGAQPVAQALEPGQFVLELVAAGFLAIGEIGTYHADAGVEVGADDARHVVRKTGNVAHDIGGRCLAEQRHAVVGFLAETDGLVAGFHQGGVREFVVAHFELLQRQHIDRVGSQPIQHLRQPHRERVDVPGGKFHGVTDPFGRSQNCSPSRCCWCAIHGPLPAIRRQSRVQKRRPQNRRRLRSRPPYWPAPGPGRRVRHHQ